MIIKLEPSSVKDKRFTATMSTGERISFGLKDAKNGTYIDHKNKELRKRYLARHLANKREKYLIDNLIPSPALFSAYLLWSYPSDKFTSINDNVNYLNSMLASHPARKVR